MLAYLVDEFVGVDSVEEAPVVACDDIGYLLRLEHLED